MDEKIKLELVRKAAQNLQIEIFATERSIAEIKKTGRRDIPLEEIREDIKSIRGAYSYLKAALEIPDKPGVALNIEARHENKGKMRLSSDKETARRAKLV